ncbi:Ferritin-like domain-containing protein [Abditibacterium utsteinense]|uniref:Ferritin-like domain-containing protein n=1 Tax=Abditibacterium utsteinense TaxID=1960156 RepID=A0A2S8STW2_9BACT|nr:ferritin-like domain-containing protein [Abditibacterium utsteinense]PQV64244.1 Ferritin-like domain-containing protein [Abditibacterium utsteinense]
MNDIKIETSGAALSETTSATARDTSRRDWLRHAGTVAGILALGSTATRVLAQDAAPGAAMPGTDPGTEAMPGMTPADGQSAAPMMADKEYASVVEDKATNPNHPEIVIPRAAKTAAPSDVEILNFALGLEYLEADFYARVVQAHQDRAYLPPRVYQAAQKLATDEAAHVEAILDILGRAGATPVAKPQFQFPENVFFAPLAFLDLAATFEVTGTGAYLGAAPKVKSSDALKFAASVYGIEARHTALIRSLNGQTFAPSAFELPLTVEEVTKRVAPFILSA